MKQHYSYTANEMGDKPKVMVKSCKSCRHDPKSCKFQNYDNKCNGHQQISIDAKIKEVNRLQLAGLNWKSLQKEIDYFNWGVK